MAGSRFSTDVSVRARWVEASCVRLRRKGLSFRATARRLTAAGNGDSEALRDLPPIDDVIFPPDYRISPKGCHKAFTKAMFRLPLAEAEEMRRLDLERCEEIFLSLRHGIERGHVPSIQIALAVLEHKAKLLRYGAERSSAARKKIEPRPSERADGPESPQRLNEILQVLEKAGCVNRVQGSSNNGELKGEHAS